MNLKIVLRDVSTKTGKGNIKFGIYIKGYDRTFISTEIYLEPEYFDSENEIVKKNLKQSAKYNAVLFAQKERYLSYFEQLGGSALKTNPKEFKTLLLAYDNIKSSSCTKSISDFVGVIDKIIYDLRNEETTEEMKRDRYASSFVTVRNTLVEFFKSETIYFQSIDKYALVEFKKYFLGKGGKESSFNNRLRIIRRVFNVAISQKLISSDLYPFTDYQIPSDYESEIRCLDIDVLREFYKTSGIGRDFFFLSFFLCGMNMKDIFYIPHSEDYIDIKRLKTSRTVRPSRLRLKLQPEVLEIIERHSGVDKNRLIKTVQGSPADFRTIVNRNIKTTINNINEGGLNLPVFTQIYARHSWATIAGELGVPDSTIDKALMHSVTGQMIEKYRKYDYSQIDIANRMIIDYLLER